MPRVPGRSQISPEKRAYFLTLTCYRVPIALSLEYQPSRKLPGKTFIRRLCLWACAANHEEAMHRMRVIYEDRLAWVGVPEAMHSNRIHYRDTEEEP